MGYRKASYEEYCKASAYAKIRYRYGVYIQLVALLLLLCLFIYTIKNIEEMKANPVEYAEEKLGVTCNYPIGTFPTEIKEEDINGIRGNFKNISG